MAEPVGDESIFLRLDLLKNGLIQFTDACCPAKPDSLGVLQNKTSQKNIWSLRYTQTPKPKSLQLFRRPP
jgi:hypothetical protein